MTRSSGSRQLDGPLRGLTSFTTTTRFTIVTGGHEAIEGDTLRTLLDEWNVRHIVSIVHRMPTIRLPKPYVAPVLSLTWIPVHDDGVIAPEDVARAVQAPSPLLVHCHLGQNRSVALTACVLIAQGDIDDPGAAIDLVERARLPALRSIGRSRPKVSPQMRKNVEQFAAYWRAGVIK